MDTTPKKCQYKRCYRNAPKGEKYCAGCRKLALKEMRAAGYIEPTPYSEHRTEDQKESLIETKRGPVW